MAHLKYFVDLVLKNLSEDALSYDDLFERMTKKSTTRDLVLRKALNMTLYLLTGNSLVMMRNGKYHKCCINPNLYNDLYIRCIKSKFPYKVRLKKPKPNSDLSNTLQSSEISNKKRKLSSVEDADDDIPTGSMFPAQDMKSDDDDVPTGSMFPAQDIKSDDVAVAENSYVFDQNASDAGQNVVENAAEKLGEQIAEKSSVEQQSMDQSKESAENLADVTEELSAAKD